MSKKANPWVGAAKIIGIPVAFSTVIWLMVFLFVMWWGWLGGVIAVAIVISAAFIATGIEIKNE